MIYLVAGEIDVLTMYEAGIQNVICWLSGERRCSIVPGGGSSTLGGVQVVYFTDRDETGPLSAEKVGRMLWGASMESARSSFRISGDKGDINNLWKWHEFR